MIEGKVQISISDFDKLREVSKRYDLLIKTLQRCTNVEVKEVEKDGDCWIQIIEVDAKKVARIAAEYSGVEEIYEDDVIKLVNVDE